MLEVIILPYMAVSFSIGWAIFSPFSVLEDLPSLTFDRPRTIDLLASFLPLSFLMSIAIASVPEGISGATISALLVVAALLYSAVAFAAGLYLMSKMNRAPALNRVIVTGILVPFGSLLTIGWFVIPIWASSYSILLSMPATLAIVGCTLALRRLGGWACAVATASESDTGNSSELKGRNGL